MLEEILDEIISMYEDTFSFQGVAATYSPDEVEEYECYVVFQKILQGQEYITGIRYSSEDGKLPSKGLNITHLDNEYGKLSVINPDYEYSDSQAETLNDLFETSDEYYNFIKAVKNHSRKETLSNISKLIRSGNLEWSEPEEETLEKEYTGGDHDAIHVTMRAEYGDTEFEYSYLDDEEVLELLFDDISDDDPVAYDEYMNYAPKLTVKVEDSYLNTMYDLSPEEIELLEGEDVDSVNEEVLFDIKDVIVRIDNALCIEQDHDIEEVTAQVYILNRSTYEKKLYEVPVFYCDTCKRYYIIESQFQKLYAAGIICCRIVDVNTIKSNKSLLADESILMSYGYTVSKQAGLSDKERRMILDMVISSGVWNKKRCISFLNWLIKRNAAQPSKKEAINKWNSDVKYLESGKTTLPENIKIGKFILK